jgi:hypothetical protein
MKSAVRVREAAYGRSLAAAIDSEWYQLTPERAVRIVSRFDGSGYEALLNYANKPCRF